MLPSGVLARRSPLVNQRVIPYVYGLEVEACSVHSCLESRRRRHPDSGRGVRHDHLSASDGDAPRADATSGRGLAVPVLAVADDGPLDEGVGGGPPQAPRVHRRRRRSPQPALMGFWSVQLGNVFHYIKEAKNPAVVERYARDIEDDWWERTCSGTAASGRRSARSRCAVSSASAGGCSPRAFTRRCTSSCCRRRSTGCATPSATGTSTTRRPIFAFLALLTGGEGLHNNHHGYPRSPKFSFRPSEIDPAWPVIKLLIALKLATPNKTIEEVAA